MFSDCGSSAVLDSIDQESRWYVSQVRFEVALVLFVTCLQLGTVPWIPHLTLSLTPIDSQRYRICRLCPSFRLHRPGYHLHNRWPIGPSRILDRHHPLYAFNHFFVNLPTEPGF